MRSEVEIELYRHFLALGFPPGAVIYEPAFIAPAGGKRFRPDFALMDPRTGATMAIVEQKDARGSLERAAQQVSDYVKQLGSPSVRGYVASRSEGGFTFFQAQEGEEPKEVDPSFLTFDALTSANAAEEKTALVQAKKRAIDYFFVVCYSLAACSIALAVADYFGRSRGVEVLTAPRLTVLAVGAALLVLPFLQKFKALGVEIERGTGTG